MRARREIVYRAVLALAQRPEAVDQPADPGHVPGMNFSRTRGAGCRRPADRRRARRGCRRPACPSLPVRRARRRIVEHEVHAADQDRDQQPQKAGARSLSSLFGSSRRREREHTGSERQHQAQHTSPPGGETRRSATPRPARAGLFTAGIRSRPPRSGNPGRRRPSPRPAGDSAPACPAGASAARSTSVSLPGSTSRAWWRRSSCRA